MTNENQDEEESAQQKELRMLSEKIERGERLTNDERARRQGLIFNHGGKASGFCVI